MSEQSICWDCQNTNGYKCSWFSKKATPVDGWEAQRRDIQVGNRSVRSYFVTQCPNFVKEQYDMIKRTSIRDQRSESVPMSVRERMGVALKRCLKGNKLSARALARAIGKSEDTVYRYLRGDVSYSPGVIAEVLPDIEDYIKAEV